MNYTLGVDVSHNNGILSLAKLKATGHCQFAIIRVCHGTTLDRQFAANLAACKTLKIPYAFYWYAESATVSGAQAEARFALSKIAGTSPLFVAYDAECDALAALGKNQTTDTAWAALELVKNAGYAPWVYSNENWKQNEIDIQYLKNKGVKFWYARYTGQNPDEASYASQCDMWQYSSTGKLSGNGSQYIDLDACYNSALNVKIGGGGVTAGSSYCDTTMDIKIRRGQTYTVATGSKNVTTGNGAVIQTAGQTVSGGKYLTTLKAAGAVGQGAGVFVNGVKKFVATVV